MITTNCELCFANSPFHRFLSEEELGYVQKSSCNVSFHAGEIICKQGTKITNLGTIISGLAKVYMEGLSSKYLILSFLKIGDVVADPGIHTSGTHQYTVMALADSKVCFIDYPKFAEILGVNPLLAWEFNRYQSIIQAEMLHRMYGLTQKQMHGRMAEAVLHLARVVYSQNSYLGLISRQDIADFSAMSKDSAIRILKEFERDGLLELTGKQIRVIDERRLVDIAEKG